MKSVFCSSMLVASLTLAFAGCSGKSDSTDGVVVATPTPSTPSPIFIDDSPTAIPTATPVPTVAATPAQPNYVNVNNCNPSQAMQLIQAYQAASGSITTDQLREACATIGNVSTPLEYIIKYKLSYIGTCAEQNTPGKSVNLTEVIDLDSSLQCLPASQNSLKNLYAVWLSGAGCSNALDASYRYNDADFRTCMGDYYSQWQTYFKANAPATWDSKGVSDLFMRWAMVHAPSHMGCASGLIKMFINR